jgi:hypothetical protein
MVSGSTITVVCSAAFSFGPHPESMEEEPKRTDMLLIPVVSRNFLREYLFIDFII